MVMVIPFRSWFSGRAVGGPRAEHPRYLDQTSVDYRFVA